MAKRQAGQPRWGKRLAIAAGVLIVLFLALDRGGVVLAERAAANTLQKSQHFSDRPSVGIAGFPFLTQLVHGSLDEVTVRAPGAVVGEQGRTVRLSSVDVTLHGLSVTRDLSTITAQSGRASAVVPYSEIARALGVGIRYGGSGRVVVRVSVPVAGRNVTLSASAGVRVTDGSLHLLSPKLADRAGSLPQPVIDQVLRAVDGLSLPLTRMPFGLSIRSVSARADGIAFELTGEDLRYVR